MKTFTQVSVRLSSLVWWRVTQVFYNTYPTLLLFFAVKLQVNKLGPILDNDSPVAPFDARSHDVIVPSLGGNHAAHFPLVAFFCLVDDNHEISVL